MDADDTGFEPLEAAAHGRAASWDLERAPARWTFGPRRHGPINGIAYVEIGVRAAAFALDLAVAGVIGEGVARITLPLLLGMAPAATNDLVLFGVIDFAPPIVAVVALAAYFLSTYRATPGQMALGLFSVRAASGRPLAPIVATWRALILFAPWLIMGLGLPQFIQQVVQQAGISAVPDWVLAGFIGGPVAWYVLLAVTIVMDRRGRGLHDRLTGASVVRRAGSAS